MKSSDVLQSENCILISSMQHSWQLKAVAYSDIRTILEDGQSGQERSVHFFK